MPNSDIARLSAIALLLVCSGITQATTVPSAYRSVAEAHGIPTALFYAIALTESGYSTAGWDKLRPWPWTANFEGQGRFFPSRQAAWHAITVFLAEGKRSVDIGLMQVNWRYHGATLGTVWRALDPYFNLNIAAGILLDCYQRLNDWWASAGCYHAPSNATRAEQYRQRVHQHWQRL